MKPITLRFKCFGSFITERTIRFDRLAEYGLFLICGETGAGKTTILDAMCCALYGSCSGEIRGDFADMRCRQAAPDDPTEVELIFECGGKRYRFLRSLVRHNSRDKEAAVTYDEKISCCVWQDESWTPLLDNSKKKDMNKKARDLIGLDLDQFRQVVILPQGKFETLLTSTSEEKESILSSIFHTARWQKAVEVMNNELKTRNKELEKEEQSIREGLTRLGAASVDELPEIRENAREAMEKAKEAEETAKADKRKAEELQSLKKEFQELDKRQKGFDAAKEAVKDDPGIRELLEKAKKAEIARRPHDEWKKAEQDLKRAEEQAADAERKLRLAEAKRDQIKKERENHEQLNEANEKQKTEKLRLSALQDNYQKISGLEAGAAEAKRRAETAQKKADTAKEEQDQEQKKLEDRLADWQNAGNDAQAKAAAYQAATIGHLAAALTEGEACPVCGSPHHPRPAALPDGAVSGEDVEKANKQVNQAKKAYDAQVTARDGRKEAYQKAYEALTTAIADSREANARLEEARKQRDPELETLEALMLRMKELDSAISAYEKRKEELNKAWTKAEADHQTGENTLAEKKKAAEEAGTARADKEREWLKALAETELETEDRYLQVILPPEKQVAIAEGLAERKTRLDNAEKLLKEQQEKLAGTERPDMETVDAFCKEAEEKYGKALREKAVAENKLKETENDAEDLTRRNSSVLEKRELYRADSEFQRALQGSNGMSIQRYVLAVRLGQVIAEANRLLANIYGGRYRLHRSDESYGTAHKSGLELEVYDSMNDQRRSVCTLSGGEKFLVALSLAIGLSTVVQNEQRGVNLEAMFIDEGFGSLDQNTLGDALDVLQSVQRGHGLVGIISHIQLLEETIPTKLTIEKAERESRITGPAGVIE